MKGVKTGAFLLFFFLIGILGFSDDYENRTALIVGNGEYQSAPLRNPVNDAADMAEKLEELGFAVNLLTDAGRGEIDRAVREFAAGLQRQSGVGLFYYAGHGMQVDGYNYLIPVDADIEAENEIAYKGYNVGQVLEKMESAGNPTNIVILDACRDNPFARSFRSSSRGLSVVEAPQGSLIVYATAPGDTAAEGRGRNGTFTGAFLKNLERTGVDVESMMRDVRAEVISETDGKQVPWSSSSLTEPFYFAPAELMLAKVEAEKRKVETELRALEEEIARREDAIAAAESEAERQRLEIEQQRQRALQEAKRIEQENLEREAERQREEAERQRKAEEARRVQREKEEARRKEMEALAEQKRREAERLKLAGDDPDLLIENIETLEQAIGEIETTFAETWRKTKEEIEKTYEIKLENVEAMEAEPWESDDEFAERQKKARAEVEREKAKELREREAAHERSKQAQMKELEEKLASAVETLESKSWKLAGSDVTVTPGEFDRETKKWPFFVESNVPEVPFKTLVVKDLSSASDLRNAYTEIDNAIKADALMGRISWSIDRIQTASSGYGNYGGPMRMKTEYQVKVGSVFVQDVTQDNKSLAYGYENSVVAAFKAGNRKDPQSKGATVTFTSTAGPTEVYYKGVKIGTTPFTADYFREGEIEVEYKNNLVENQIKETETIVGGKNTIIFKTGKYVQIGDTFAGGIVFYLDGKGGGLVAAPRDQSDDIQWGGYRTDIGNTSTAVGTGASNTRAIVSKLGRGSYAAKLCEDLTLNGYDDWFLPSKEELNLMYENLHKKGIGGFADGYYWSSSESSNYNAWLQNFSSGYQYSNKSKHLNSRVRAVRAF